MRKILIVITAIALSAAVVWFGRSVAVGSPTPLASETARATRREINSSVKATGVVRAAIDAEVRVGVQAPGVLRRLHVRLGESVVKGQLLAELESRSLKAKQNQAAAAVHSNQANLAFETTDLARKRRLVEQAALAPRELEAAERTFALAEASLAEARANLAYARALLDETRVLAPISGVVASIAAREGEAVSAGLAAPTFLTLVDLKRLETWAYVDETDIGRVEIGQKARFTVDTYPDREIEGQVIAVHPKPEIRDNVVNYVVAVGFEVPVDVTLRPEMTANVRIALAKREKAVTVPRRSVHREQGRSFVVLLAEGGRTRRYVKVGAKDENNAEILEGLSDGTEVLVGELPSENGSAE